MLTNRNECDIITISQSYVHGFEEKIVFTNEKKCDIININGLKKSFGDIKAVNDISFRVKQGELFAFLGVNGAGKSTTISILCGRLSKDSGTVVVDGVDIDNNPDAVKRSIGVVFQNSVLDKALTVKDNLRYKAALYGIQGADYDARLKELCDMLLLEELLNRYVGKLSGGQRRRVDIARALLHSPKILVLDEPTTGLDPQTRNNLWSVLEKLRKEQGVTVFLTTHYMEEAADADHVVILDNGKIVASGTPLELKNTYTADYITVYNVDEEKVKAMGYPYIRINSAFRIALPNTAAATKLILQTPDNFTDYEITKGKMDDVFLAVTGKSLKGGADNA